MRNSMKMWYINWCNFEGNSSNFSNGISKIFKLKTNIYHRFGLKGKINLATWNLGYSWLFSLFPGKNPQHAQQNMMSTGLIQIQKKSQTHTMNQAQTNYQSLYQEISVKLLNLITLSFHYFFFLQIHILSRKGSRLLYGIQWKFCMLKTFSTIICRRPTFLHCQISLISSI